MENPYRYIASADYINNLKFEYIETYSFQRGIEYQEKSELDKSEYLKLRERKERLNNLTQSEEYNLSELNNLFGKTQYLINEFGNLHPSARKINTFEFSNPIIENLRDVLITKIVDIPRWLCAPTYRDGIIFYNNSNEKVSVLNVCLECQYMETQKFNHINGDYETYDLLKRFFLSIGHEVEEPTRFPYEEIRELRNMHQRQ